MVTRKEKKKTLLFVVAIIFGMIVFGVVLKVLDNHMKEADVPDGYFLNDNQEDFKEEPQGSVKLSGKTYDYFHQFETFLVIGTDNTGKDEKVYQGSMSDFLMLIAYDKTDKAYSFLPINRDTITKVHLIDENGEGEATADIQVCTAHWYGGNAEQSCENTVKAVSDMLGGINIDGYYSIPMDSIAGLNHEVGGVTLTLLDDFSDVDSTMTKGNTITLSDEQAYHYIHDRYGIGDEENTSRMKRQQQYMKEMFKKVKSNIKNDGNFANNLFKNMENIAVTNMKAKKASKLAYDITKGTSKGFFEIEGKNKTGQLLGDNVDHAEFYADKKSKLEILQKMYDLEKREDDGN